MNDIPRELKLYETLAALGFAIAIVCAVLYFMRLPIFDVTAISWFFVVGLLSFAAALLAVVLRGIWAQP